MTDLRCALFRCRVVKECTELTVFYINTKPSTMRSVLDGLKDEHFGFDSTGWRRYIYFMVPSKCRRSLTASRQLTSPGGTVLTRRLRPSGTVHRLRYDFLGVFDVPVPML